MFRNLLRKLSLAVCLVSMPLCFCFGFGQNANANFTYTPSSVCVNVPVTFTNTSNPGLSPQWDFNNDGVFDASGSPVTHTFTTPGTYNVRLYVQGTFGGWFYGSPDSKIVSITVGVGPQPIFSLPDTELCEGATLQLSASSPSGSPTFTWAGPNGFSSGAADTSISDITTAGMGYYYLTLTNPTTGCYGEDSIHVTIHPTPNVDLGPDTFFCDGDSVKLFNRNSFSGNVVWSTGSTLHDIYVDEPGTFTETITNTYGCVGSDTVSVVSVARPQLTLKSDTTTCYGETISLNAGSQPSGSTYYWSNGSTSQITQVSDTGMYYVTVDNHHGCTTTDSIYVHALPMAIVSGINGILNSSSNTFDFSPIGASDVDSYLWDFGDGTTSTDSAVQHHYTQAGDYTVTLVVGTTDGCKPDTVQTLIRFIPTGIQQASLNNSQIKIFPNPADQMVTIKNVGQLQMQSVEVFNMLGRKVVDANHINSAASYRLNVQSLAAGLYHVKVIFTNGTFVSRKFEIRR